MPVSSRTFGPCSGPASRRYAVAVHGTELLTPEFGMNACIRSSFCLCLRLRAYGEASSTQRFIGVAWCASYRRLSYDNETTDVYFAPSTMILNWNIWSAAWYSG